MRAKSRYVAWIIPNILSDGYALHVQETDLVPSIGMEIIDHKLGTQYSVSRVAYIQIGGEDVLFTKLEPTPKPVPFVTEEMERKVAQLILDIH